jgi:hypothetical protein
MKSQGILDPSLVFPLAHLPLLEGTLLVSAGQEVRGRGRTRSGGKAGTHQEAGVYCRATLAHHLLALLPPIPPSCLCPQPPALQGLVEN